MTITLYDLAGAEDARRFSPYCWRVKMALRHKGLAVYEVPWRFTEKDRIAFSGSQTVPVIVDGNTVVADSWEIAGYLERAYSDRPSLFGGPVGVAQALFIKFWCEQSLHPLVLRIVLLDLFARLHDKDKAYFRRSREERLGKPLEEAVLAPDEGVPMLRAALAPLRATLERQPFLGGAGAVFADYMVFGVFQWAGMMSPITLLEASDPVFFWREQLLDLFDGFARRALAQAS